MFKENGDVLDFGCGAGNFAKYLSEKGYEVDCLDVNKEAINWVRKIHGLPITKEIPNKKYDLILLNTVLEHLPNPINEMEKIKKHLKEDGIIIIAIQNINSLQARLFRRNWFHLDAPRHITHFYKDSFEKMTKKENLKIIKKFYFNLNIDPAGWYWSIKKPAYNRHHEIKNPSRVMLCLFVPLVAITSLLKSTGQIIYVITRDKK